MAQPMLHGPLIGQLFETMVVSKWLKAFYHRGKTLELYYWRSKGGMAVDHIVNRDGRLYPIEIKSTLLPGHMGPLIRWRELAGDLASAGIVIANISETFTLKYCRAISWETGLDMF